MKTKNGDLIIRSNFLFS